MKLFSKLYVASATLTLLSPLAASASDININGIADYSKTNNRKVETISTFSDVYPSDWAYQELVNLAKRNNCKVSLTSSSMTRYEAAALINSCLSNISEASIAERRLISEFAPEIAVIKGRVGRIDGVEADVGAVGPDSFSSTTKLSGTTVFVVGGVDEVADKEAVTFHYDTKLALNTSFTGDDLLKTRIRSGNFGSSPFSFADGAASSLEVASSTSNSLTIDRAYYQFPVGENLTATVGALVRQDDMLGVWPSSYPSDSILDVLTYAGANAAYSLAEGAGAGITYAKDNLSASLVLVSDEATDASQGILTEQGSDDITAQLAWVADNFTVAAAYTTSDGGNTTDTADANDFDAWGLSAQYDLDNGISLNAGMGWKTPDEENDASNIEDETTWSLGVVWSDFGAEGNTLGFAYGTAEGHRDDSGYDDPMAYEVYYSMAVSDNITVTPAFFTIEKDGTEDVTGGIVKTTFSF